MKKKVFLRWCQHISVMLCSSHITLPSFIYIFNDWHDHPHNLELLENDGICMYNDSGWVVVNAMLLQFPYLLRSIVTRFEHYITDLVLKLLLHRLLTVFEKGLL